MNVRYCECATALFHHDNEHAPRPAAQFSHIARVSAFRNHTRNIGCIFLWTTRDWPFSSQYDVLALA